jgi:hypothetical protein
MRACMYVGVFLFVFDVVFLVAFVVGLGVSYALRFVFTRLWGFMWSDMDRYEPRGPLGLIRPCGCPRAPMGPYS